MSGDSERLRRIERSISQLEADSRPARLKEGLLSALRKERDSLKASTLRAAARSTPLAKEQPRR
jgi:hypothetical protein